MGAIGTNQPIVAIEEFIMNTNAIASSTSALAIAQSTQPVTTGVVIPFRKPEALPVTDDIQPATEPVAVGEVIAFTADNDNDPEGDCGIDAHDEGLPRGALIERSHLARAVEIVREAVEGQSPIPILSHIRIQAVRKSIEVTGTDLDIEIVATLPAAVDRGFDTTLNARKLKELLKGAPKGDYVSLEIGDDAVSADFEKVRYRLQALDADNFPTRNVVSDGAAFRLPGNDFVGALESVAGAMSTDERRYYLNGVFMHVYDYGDRQEFRFATTDGHRLYRQTLDMPDMSRPIPVTNGHTPGVLIPRKTVAILTKLMRGKKCPEHVDIEVGAAKSRYVFAYEFGTVSVTTKHIDGTFPDYQRVVPSYSNYPAARFQPAALAETIKACALISSERGHAFKLSVSETGASIDVNNPAEGSAHASVACDWLSEPVEIGFNASYMLEAIDVAGTGMVGIHISDSSSPVAVVGDRKGWLGVLMPMRV
jgi:DNA polymerase-3 subunit beta